MNWTCVTRPTSGIPSRAWRFRPGGPTDGGSGGDQHVELEGPPSGCDRRPTLRGRGASRAAPEVSRNRPHGVSRGPPGDHGAHGVPRMPVYLHGNPGTHRPTPARSRRSFGIIADCHRDGALAPWSMDSHARVKNNAAMIEEVLLTHRMPPWSADPTSDTSPTTPPDAGRSADAPAMGCRRGSPRGEGPDPLTEPPPPLGAWALGTPDTVIRLPELQQIPATGVLEYRQIPIPSPFTNGVWIAAMEVKPGNRKVVHHAILYAKWPGCPDGGTGKGVHLYGWAPGTPSLRYPDGVGSSCPPARELTMEMHYTTCGSPRRIRPNWRSNSCPRPRPARPRHARPSSWTSTFRPAATRRGIPPPMPLSVRPRSTFWRPTCIVRGKWMRYELLRPDGKRQHPASCPGMTSSGNSGYMLKEPCTCRPDPGCSSRAPSIIPRATGQSGPEEAGPLRPAILGRDVHRILRRRGRPEPVRRRDRSAAAGGQP